MRAILGGLPLLAGAVVFARPDLLVLATPLAVIALWGTIIRPSPDAPVHAATRLAHSVVREGEATRWEAVVDVPAGAEQVAAMVASDPWSHHDPTTGAAVVAVASARHGDDGTRDAGGPVGVAPPIEVTAPIGVRSIRWGRREVGPSRVAASSGWGAYIAGPMTFPPVGFTTLPVPTTFDARAPLPHPSGVVGLHRSTRMGDGAEFAGIRPFQLGDRLRRIHWPVSLRSDALHVAASYLDRDTEVALIIDATTDVGPSDGIDGAASSLDLTVRAAGALAEHFLHRGDRVGLSVMGSSAASRVPARSGRRHLRQILDRLAAIEIVSQAQAARATHDLQAGAVVVMLSPLTTAAALEHAVVTARRGLTVLVIDTLPHDIVESGDDAFEGLAWRIRLLEREREQRRVEQLGVPVIRWRGPGSLDHVLRDMTRRAGAPKLVRR